VVCYCLGIYSFFTPRFNGTVVHDDSSPDSNCQQIIIFRSPRFRPRWTVVYKVKVWQCL